MAAPVEPVLLADSIGKGFGGRKVLRSAFLWARAGRVTGLLGRNGEGKSTLLQIAAGLMAAEHGTVRFRGRVHTRPSLPALARRGLFFLPADRPLLSPTLTLEKHFRLFGAAFPEADAAWAVEAAGVAPFLSARPAELSGGERRRAELAVALCRNPACLLLDEPFRGLAPLDAERIGRIVREVAGRGCAVVLTGHELPFVMGTVDEVIWLHGGATRLLGTPAEAKANHEFRAYFLGRA
ncbi:MAG TPA: ATP-binding cassette domain-containing protein [Longimicrobium sp.]|nr:ATP-binding cassette domain-containing protein [Longimicrobium sp.]